MVTAMVGKDITYPILPETRLAETKIADEETNAGRS
jgi:hypothetical protein